MKPRAMLYLHSCISFSVLTTVLIFGGCSSAPSASDAEKVVENQIHKQTQDLIKVGLIQQGLIKLVGFEKTNAQKADVMGIKVYTIEYQAEIEFLDDCWWGGPLEGMVFEAIPGEPGPFNAFLYMGKKRVRKGQREKVRGEIQFEKTEKGWRGPDGQIY